MAHVGKKLSSSAQTRMKIIVLSVQTGAFGGWAS